MNKVVVASISYNGALKFKQSLYIIELGILICNSSMMTLVLTLLLKWGRTVCAKCVRLGRSYLGSPTLIKYWNPWFSTTLYGLMSMAINAATPWVKCLCRSLVCESFCFSLNISGIVGAVVFLTILAGVFFRRRGRHWTLVKWEKINRKRGKLVMVGNPFSTCDFLKKNQSFHWQLI